MSEETPFTFVHHEKRDDLINLIVSDGQTTFDVDVKIATDNGRVFLVIQGEDLGTGRPKVFTHFDGGVKFRLMAEHKEVEEVLNNHLRLSLNDFNALTPQQKESAAKVIVQQGYGLQRAHVTDEYLGLQFEHIFIGVEKDGYAHS